jgi:hypothetical protein
MTMDNPDPIKFGNLLRITAVLIPYTAYIVYLSTR